SLRRRPMTIWRVIAAWVGEAAVRPEAGQRPGRASYSLPVTVPVRTVRLREPATCVATRRPHVNRRANSPGVKETVSADLREPADLLEKPPPKSWSVAVVLCWLRPTTRPSPARRHRRRRRRPWALPHLPGHQ